MSNRPIFQPFEAAQPHLRKPLVFRKTLVHSKTIDRGVLIWIGCDLMLSWLARRGLRVIWIEPLYG